MRPPSRLPVAGYVIVPALGAAVDVYLLTQLSSIAIRLGLSWLALGIVYLAVLTRGFRRPPPTMRLGGHEAADASPASPREERRAGA